MQTAATAVGSAKLHPMSPPAEPEPIFVDLERPEGMADPVRVHPGDLLIFRRDLTDLRSAAALTETVRKLLREINANTPGVTAIILSTTLTVDVLRETDMAKHGWVRQK